MILRRKFMNGSFDDAKHEKPIQRKPGSYVMGDKHMNCCRICIGAYAKLYSPKVDFEV
jgi:hypothetical protein